MTVSTVGLLYPGFGAEDDFPWFAQRHRDVLALPLVHTSVGEDAHRVDALLDLGSEERLRDGADALMAHGPDSVVWACTSGSFVFGWDGARRQVDALSEHTDRPATSTSLAFVEAVRHLGVSRVAVAASYPEDVAVHFREFLRRADITVAGSSSHGIVTAAEVGLLTRDQVVALAAAADTDGAEALLVPDTAMHTLRWLDDLEEAAGMPVLTANQVSVWAGLHLLDATRALPAAGRLFAA